MVSANDLKVQGIKAIDKEIQNKEETIITFRGKPRYVVMEFNRYDELRAYELDKAYLETMRDIERGDYKTLTTDEELKRHLESL